MSHSHDDLQAQINDLARRITQLERRAGDSSLDTPVEVAPPAPPTPQTPPAVEIPKPPTPDEKREALERLTAMRERALAERTPEQIFALEKPSRPTSPKRDKAGARQGLNVEQFVGAKLFAVVGSLVIVVGAALLLKVAWDAGWFNMLSDGAKCVSGAVFGALLLVAGEVARRKINAFASIGCTAAGIGVLYASAFAAYGFFGLIGHETGFALLAAVAALGVLVGARARMASVSALSIVAAYAVPLFFLDVEPKPLVLPVYLSSILLIGLTLSGMLGRNFVLLRSLVWWGTVIFGGAWAILGGTDHLAIALCYLGFSWAAIHAELLISAARRGLTGEDKPSTALDSWRAVRPIASSFSVTAWAALLGSVAVFDATGESWVVSAFLAGAMGVLAVVFGDGLRFLRETPADDTRRLSCVFAVECGALVIAAVALGLAGWLEVTAWIALGASAVLAGRLLRARPLDVYGLVVLTLVSCRIITIDHYFNAIDTDSTVWLGMHLTRWSVLVATCAGAWAFAGWLLLRSVRGLAYEFAWRSIGRACVAIGITLFFAAGLHEETTNLATIWLVLGCAGATLAASRWLRSDGVRIYSLLGPGFWGFLGVVALFLQSEPDRALTVDGASTVLAWTAFTPAVLGAVVYWFAAAVLLTRDRAREWWSKGVPWCVAPGLFCLFLTARHPESAYWASAWAWLAMTLIVWSAHRLTPALALRRWALAGAIAAALMWAEAFATAGWSRFGDAPLAHHGLWQGLAIGAAMLVIAVRNARREEPVTTAMLWAMTGAAASVGLTLWATSLEAGRIAELYTTQEMSRRAAVSIWWGVFAIGLIGAGFWRNIPLVRHAGLGLLAVATSKAVIFDLVDVPAGWRAVSFLALGLMMLAVGLVYAKVSASVAGEQRGEGSGAD